jgi:hypothetical protein
MKEEFGSQLQQLMPAPPTFEGTAWSNMEKLLQSETGKAECMGG